MQKGRGKGVGILFLVAGIGLTVSVNDSFAGPRRRGGSVPGPPAGDGDGADRPPS